MIRRQWLWVWLGAGLLLLIAIALGALPEVVRRVAISKIGAATGRQVEIGDVDINLFTGRVAVKAFRLGDRGPVEPFVTFDQLEARLHLLPLLAGHLRVARANLRAPMIRIVRTGQKEFNFSDLLAPSTTEAPAKRGGFDVTVEDLTLVGGWVSVEDRAIVPSRAWKVEDLSVQVHDLSTRSTGAGGSASVTFTLAGTPVSVKADRLRLVPANAHVTATAKKFDLALLGPYLPHDAPSTLQSGLLSASLDIEYGASTGGRIGGSAQLDNLVLVRRGQTSPFVSVPVLTVAFKDIAVTGAGVTAGRIELAGDPSVFDTSISPPARFDLKTVRAGVEGATWPARGPARVKVTAGLPRGGDLNAQGTIQLGPVGADLRLVLSGVDIAPYQPYLPIATPLAGKADANLTIVGSMGSPATASARGKAGLSRLRLGSPDHPVVSVERVDASGIDIRWPSHVTIGRILVRKPSALIERDEHGALPLRAMFARPSTGSPQILPAKTTAPAVTAAPGQKRVDEIGELVIEDGYARFVDHTISPSYSEELLRLSVSIKGLTNAPGERGQFVAQGVIGASGAIDLHGEVAPLGESLYVDLEGELRDFAIPRVNPYVNRAVAWIARDGQLSTKVHFRLDGNRLESRNEIIVGRLDLVQAGENDEVKRRIGLPLGLLVALMKDVRGEIRVAVPVSGRLGAPEFNFAEAIWTAVRNAVVNILTAPFKLIGRLFTKGDVIEAVAIDPIRFEPGSSVISPAMEQQLQRVAGFLGASPFVRLAVSPVVSAGDVTVLKTQEVMARIQRLQREAQLAEFSMAATHLFVERFPDRTTPETVDEIVATLRDAEPMPEEGAHTLGARRAKIVREALIKTAGIEAKRLQTAETLAAFGASGDARVEFSITP